MNHFFQKKSVEGFNTISTEFLTETRQTFNESEESKPDKRNRLEPILEDYENVVSETRETPKQFFM